MKNKSYIVTGASSGLGYDITQSLLDQGAQVFALARSISECKFNHDERLECIKIDFSDDKQTIDIIELLKQSIKNLTGMIFCAGYGRFGSLEEFSYQQIKQQMDVNYLSHAYLCKAFTPLLKHHNSGDIIFIGSNAALNGTRKGTIYCASKFALRGFAQALRDECGRNHVRITIINPGMIESAFYKDLDFTPGPKPEHKIDVEQITSTINHILSSNPTTVFDEINMSPLSHVIQKN